MGSYRCSLRNKLKPASHDEWHPDMVSSICPVLRDAIEQAACSENYKRLKKLLKLAEDNGFGFMFNY